MVSMRVFCCLVMFFILQLHAKVCNANFNSQVPKTADSEGLGANIITHNTNKAIQDVIENRKTLKHIYVKVEATEKNGFEIENKETEWRSESKKRLAKTVSLTADYSDPGHHPPRHN